MTKEITNIIAAFKEASLHGRQTALATVVHVEGSSYRRPGARMLVEENGRITGAISGGCLEGDALRKALLAISQKQNKLVAYNTQEEDDVEFGIQLGCNGIVYILFEPIESSVPNNPIALLEKCLQKRKDAVVVTLFSLKNFYGHQPGTCFFFDGENVHENIPDTVFVSKLLDDAFTTLHGRSSLLKEYTDLGLTAFVELVEPLVSLVIIGAGNDALPLMEMASVLGWQIKVVDGRRTHANKQRFSKAHQILVGKPGEIIQQLKIDEWTAVLLMTHNYNYDLEMLECLLQYRCKYIGTLGPKKKLQRMWEALHDKGINISSEQKARVYGPTGLDIGAEAAEEIALSVLAEIKAVISKRQGGFLCNRRDNIHEGSVYVVDEIKAVIK